MISLTSIEISTRPGTAGAARVKVEIKILEGLEETPRELIAWRKSMDRAFIGLSCATGLQQMAALPQFTQRFAWTALEAKHHEAAEATSDRNIKAKEAELEADDGTNEARINREITALCARTKEQHLAAVNQGHVIVTKEINAWLTTLVPNKILQRVKRHLDFDGDAKKKIAQASGKAKKSKSMKAVKKNNNTSGQKHCLLQGNNNTHMTDECNTLKAQAKKPKGDTGGNAGKAKGKGENKTWNNKARTRPTSPKENLRLSLRRLSTAELSRSSSLLIRSTKAILTMMAWTSMLWMLNSRSSITMTWKNLSSRTPKMERSMMPPSLPMCLSERQARIR